MSNASLDPVTQAQTFNSRVFRLRRSEVSVTVDCMSGDDLALRTTMLFAEPRVRQATLEPLECRSYKVPSYCPEQRLRRFPYSRGCRGEADTPSEIGTSPFERPTNSRYRVVFNNPYQKIDMAKF